MNKNNSSTILLQKYKETGGLGREEAAILHVCILDRLTCSYVEEQHLLTDLNIRLYVGSVEGTKNILEQLGKSLPTPDYYPIALKQYYKNRNLRTGTILDIKHIVNNGGSVFAKPKYQWKKFTGLVLKNTNDLKKINHLHDDFVVWLSDVIAIKAEFRAYVSDYKLLALCQYSNDDDFTIDKKTILNAIDLLRKWNYKSKTYAFDWCITESNETLLVEMNGAFAIGKYAGITDKQYLEFLESGWKELLSNPTTNTSQSELKTNN